MTGTKPRLLDQLRDRIRLKHYSMRTETCYVDWVRRFVLFHDKRHPLQMGAPESQMHSRENIRMPSVRGVTSLLDAIS